MYSQSIKTVANSGNLNELGEVVQKVQLGTMLQLQQKTYTGLTGAAAHNITDAAHGSLPAIGVILSCRVTAGAAAAGVRKVGDALATPDANVVAISDDGSTLTFEANVTGFVLQYMPRAAADMAGNFARL
jgi:hypothetical protein